MKTLVVYYSRTGTNRAVAQKIAEELSADLDEVIDLKNRLGIIHWLGAGAAAVRRKTTEISSKLDPGDYDIVLLGSPVWASNMNPALRTYLDKHDLEGKKVVFFFVSKGGDPSGVVEELRTIIPSADFDHILSLSMDEVKEGKFEEKVREFARTFKVPQIGKD